MSQPIDIPSSSDTSPILNGAADDDMRHSPISIFPEPRNNAWVPDSNVSKCTRCSTIFGFWSRKHHCRACGNIFCNECCTSYVEIPEYISDITGDHAKWNPSYWIPSLFGKGDSGSAMLVCVSCESEITNVKASHGPFIQAISINQDVKTISLPNSGYDHNVVDYYKHQLRLCQLAFPGENPSTNQHILLRANALHFAGHSKYLTQLIKYCNWQNKDEVDNVLNAIRLERNCECSDLLCLSTCSRELKFDDIINIMSTYDSSMHPTVTQFVFNILKTFSPQVIMACIVHLTNLIPLCKELHKPILEVISDARKPAKNSSISYKSLLYRVFWLLEIMRDEVSVEMVGNIKAFYMMIPTKHLRIMQNEFTFFKKLLDDIDKDSVNTTFTPPVHLPYDPSIILTGIEKYEVNDSENRPVVITFKTALDTQRSVTGTKRIMLKRDNVTHDHNVSNLIHLIDMILSATISGTTEESSQLEASHLPNYTVMPLAKNIGMIEYLDAETLSAITKTTSISQYLVDNNSGDTGLTVKQIKANYSYSLVGYTLLGYFLGIGDRHLKNILITTRGELLHIDFAYLLGDQPTSVTDKSLPLTCDMVGFIGGPDSPAFAKYVRDCVKGATVLKKYWNLFHLILCQDVDEVKVEKFIRKRFQIRQRNSVVNDEVRTYVQKLYGGSILSNMIMDSSTTLLKYASQAIRMAGVIGLL